MEDIGSHKRENGHHILHDKVGGQTRKACDEKERLVERLRVVDHFENVSTSL